MPRNEFESAIQYVAVFIMAYAPMSFAIVIALIVGGIHHVSICIAGIIAGAHLTIGTQILSKMPKRGETEHKEEEQSCNSQSGE